MYFGGTQNYDKVIEYSILWKGHKNGLWSPTEMMKMIEDETYFVKDGNFYKAKKELYVFGQRLNYVGILGMNEMRGPNAHLSAKASEVAKYITEKYEIEFEEYKGAFIADIKENIFVCIYEPKSGYTSIAGGSLVDQHNMYLSKNK